MNFEQVIELASGYTLARILERDDFKTRYQANQPIGIHELLYPLVQGYDSMAINADIEVGGTDQTFNLLVGRQLMERAGMKPQTVITYPLLVGLDGKEKMSKSLDNYIGIDEPADIMFEKCMKVPDDLLYDYFKMTTDVNLEEANTLIKEDVRQAHFTYAETIVGMYHNDKLALYAKKRYNDVAKGRNPENLDEIRIPEESISIVELLKIVGFAESSSQARRHILGKGVKVDGNVVLDIHTIVNIRDSVIVQFGKNRFARVLFDNDKL